jgi:hypothetical protein
LPRLDLLARLDLADSLLDLRFLVLDAPSEFLHPRQLFVAARALRRGALGLGRVDERWHPALRGETTADAWALPETRPPAHAAALTWALARASSTSHATPQASAGASTCASAAAAAHAAAASTHAAWSHEFLLLL